MVHEGGGTEGQDLEEIVNEGQSVLGGREVGPVAGERVDREGTRSDREAQIELGTGDRDP